jgi:polyphosphate glucokinase
MVEHPAVNRRVVGSSPTRGAISSARTLAIDIGGSGLKAAVVGATGRLLTERVRVDTPVGRPPKEIVGALVRLVAPLGPYDRVAVGFPGVVRAGRVLTAVNLDNEGWTSFDLAGALERALGKPVRVANDADVQGLAVIEGKGVEMVITLGTGFGTGLYLDGRLAPHLELSHHPFRKGETYDEQLGDAARRRVGNRKWNRRVKKAIRNLRSLTSFDHLYVGGGNARRIDFDLDPDVTIVDNAAGIKGGIALWQE